MGTNYYLLKEYCHHCERGDEVHIGKTGKAFVFRGYRREDHDNPWVSHSFDASPIASYTEWMFFIANARWPIVNEYGEKITVEQLKAVIDKNPTDNQVEWIRKNKPEFSNEYFYDKDGYCFCWREFS